MPSDESGTRFLQEWDTWGAQAELVYRQQAFPGGRLDATRKPRIRAVYSWYRHQPCLAMTTWAVLAGLSRKPWRAAS
jgi:hypothetical protein